MIEAVLSTATNSLAHRPSVNLSWDWVVQHQMPEQGSSGLTPSMSLTATSILIGGIRSSFLLPSLYTLVFLLLGSAVCSILTRVFILACTRNGRSSFETHAVMWLFGLCPVSILEYQSHSGNTKPRQCTVY